jgi:hypothetical protein
MKHHFKILALLATLSTALAAPSEINYQGVLTDQQGNPVNGVRAMQIKLYDAPTGGNMTYQENIGNVTVADGIYSFHFGGNGTSIGGSIGIIDALSVSSQPWLELSVDGISQSPRQKILTVPFAQMADRLNPNKVEPKTSSALISIGRFFGWAGIPNNSMGVQYANPLVFMPISTNFGPSGAQNQANGLWIIPNYVKSINSVIIKYTNTTYNGTTGSVYFSILDHSGIVKYQTTISNATAQASITLPVSLSIPTGEEWICVFECRGGGNSSNSGSSTIHSINLDADVLSIIK